MFVAAPIRDLDHAKTVAWREQSHRLGIDSNGAGREDALGQILLVEIYGHRERIVAWG
jgi:hypothetical protein